MTSMAFIVTGASRGLGLAVAELLLRASHKVFLVARSETDLQRLKSQYPTSVEYAAADLSDLSTAPQIIKAALEAFGKINGMVINHGVLTPVTRIADSNAEEWRRAYDINVMSAVALLKEAIPELRKSKGRVVLVSSGAATSAVVAWGAYGTSKAAINHVCAHMAVEEPEITSVAISPGKVDTGMQQQIRELGKTGMAADVHASFVDEHASGRLLKPEQPGAVIAKLVEGATKDMSGRHFRWNDAVLSAFQGTK
ncbi:short-chain dehydrogenase [Pseudomassariella vexata]|uniref:Short-chain dehydrogenase n=1 Tax=Pseudomassariella vexata TaxID=1141098 RepID=A0A1Y2E7G2_9PEZI|nr:short-chain dehydrogenase [Pseudomassariella vexata]ORY67264.1 short-chain dehydrogenase [Pseudomassariella vexata]